MTSPPTTPDNGGVAQMFNSSNQLVQKLAEGTAIIPGVTITSTATCSQTQTVPDPATGVSVSQASNVSPATYQISALQGTPGTSTRGNATAVASGEHRHERPHRSSGRLVGIDRGVGFGSVNLAHSTLVVAISLVAAASGCKRDEQDVLSAPAALAPEATGSVPHDHLAQGELLAGTESAFGLVLPRGSRLESVFPQQIIASCEAKPADVANYIRPRVAMGAVKVGAASTMWDRAQVPSKPGRELSIRVEEGPTGAGTRITLRDVTPPPYDPNLTEDQRWRQAGVAPGGKLLDPTHLH